MKRKRVSRVIALVSPCLGPDERIRLVATAALRSVPSPVTCAEATVLSAVAVMAEPRPRRYDLVLTDLRLIVIRHRLPLEVPRRLSGQVRLDSIASVRTTGRAGEYDIAVCGRAKVLRLRFGRRDRALAPAFGFAAPGFGAEGSAAAEEEPYDPAPMREALEVRRADVVAAA